MTFEPRLDVLRAAVVVVEVVRVLPDVDAQQRRQAVGDRGVLVGRRDDQHARAVVHEPRPAGAERAHRRRLHRLLEDGDGAERLLDARCSSLPLGSPPPVGRHARPEQAVVDVAADVVRDRRADALGHLVELRQQLLGRHVRRPAGVLERRVGLVDVRLRGACRGGSASSPRRCAAPARRTRRAGRARCRPSVSLSAAGRVGARRTSKRDDIPHARRGETRRRPPALRVLLRSTGRLKQSSRRP